MSEDFSVLYLRDLKSDAVTYRLERYEKFARHWYPRWDFQRPAELVNAAASNGSRVVVSDKVSTVAAYLKPEFAVFWPREDIRFRGISRNAGKRELWSGRQLLSTIEEVIEYTQNADTVWLLVLGLRADPLRLDPEVAWPGRVQNVVVYRPGRDERIEVWRIELR